MSFVYNRAAAKLLENSTRINWLGDTIKVMLVTSGYTADRDHDFVSSASASELSGTGYTAGFGGAGRKTLASKTITEDDTNDRAVFDAADVTWTAINAGTAVAAIIIKENTTNADSELIAYLDGASVVTNGGDVTLVFPTTGVFYNSTV